MGRDAFTTHPRQDTYPTLKPSHRHVYARPRDKSRHEGAPSRAVFFVGPSAGSQTYGLTQPRASEIVMQFELSTGLYGPPHLAPHVHLARVDLWESVAFVLLMVGAAYVMGKLQGDDHSILPGLGSAKLGGTEDDALREALSRAADHLERGQRPPDLGTLLSAMERRESLKYISFPIAVDRLVAVYTALPSSREGADPGVTADLEGLFGVLGPKGDRELTIRILGALCRQVSHHHQAAAPLLKMSMRSPIIWNYAEAALEEAAKSQPSIRKMLREKAGGTEKFVKRSNEVYGADLTRFKRLVTDYARPMTRGAVLEELEDQLSREFAFLYHAGRCSRRFAWVTAELERLMELIDEERIQVVQEGLREGAVGTASFLNRLTTLWIADQSKQEMVRTLVASLCEAVKTHTFAADAVAILYVDLSKAYPADEGLPGEIRRTLWKALKDASEESFEIIKLMARHGIPATPVP